VRLRLALTLGLCVAAALGSCRWSELPANAVYPCESDGSCPDGFACSADALCVAVASPDDGGGRGCEPESAADACGDAGVQCGDLTLADRCGVVRTFACGGCSVGASCSRGACCQLPTAAQACGDAGYACGQLEYEACGQSLQFECSACTFPDVCEYAQTGSVCAACVPESDAALCDRYAATCGPLMGRDNCGVSRVVASCGPSCAGGGCGSDAGTSLCACQALAQGCLAAANCCSGACSPAGRCCKPTGQACSSKQECCTGFCTGGVCIVPELFPDGGQTNGRP
jgi:hypothetical protein